MDYSKIKKIIEDFKLFFIAATDYDRKSRAILAKEASEEMDNFMLLCYADELGIPISISYYTLELLPYMASDMEKWELRMMDRKSIWGEKWGDYDLDA